MYCANCGAPNKDEARFCFQCGTKLSEEVIHQEIPAPAADPVAPVTPEAVAPAPKRRKKRWIIIVIAAILLLAVAAAVTALLIFGKNSPRALIDEYCQAVFDSDGEAIFQLLPDEVLERIYGSKSDQKSIMGFLSDALEDHREDYDRQYEEWEITYGIIHVEKIKGDDLEELQDLYDDEFDCEVTAAKEVTVKLTYRMDDARHVSAATFTVVKIDGQWYLGYQLAYLADNTYWW